MNLIFFTLYVKGRVKYMRNYLVLCGILRLTLLSGCGIDEKAQSAATAAPTPKGDWIVDYSSWMTTNSLDNFAKDSANLQDAPEEGYYYLVVELSLKNRLSRSNALDWSRDKIKYRAANGTEYQMELLDEANYKNILGKKLKPQKEQSGYVFFKIPKTDNISGKLIIDFADGPKHHKISLKD